MIRRFWCISHQGEFSEDVDHGNYSRQAMCKPCCRRAINDYFDFREGKMDCKPCAGNGIFVSAYKVHNGIGYCEPCDNKRRELLAGIDHPAPPPTPSVPATSTHRPGTLESIAARDEQPEQREETPMQPKKRIDWDQVQDERNEGKSVADLAKKYVVTPTSIYNHSTAPSTTKPTKRIKRVMAPSVTDNGAGSAYYQSVRKRLLEQRERIDRTLAGLEAVKDLF